MSDNMDLKKLWEQQEIQSPDAKEIFKMSKSFKNSNLRRIFVTNVLLIITSIFIISIWFRYQPEMITTRIGIILIILAMAIFLFMHNRMIPDFMKARYDINNSEYLNQLLIIKTKQSFLHGTMLNIYFILIAAGVFIYMIEYVARMTLLWGIFAYGVTLLWIALNWFVIRPKTIRKQQNKLNELIEKVESITNQLKD